MQNTAKFWDGIAEKYARSPIADRDAYEYTLERTRSYLGSDDNVLELGCGTGSTALLLAPNVSNYTASDVSSNMVAIGKRKAAAEGVNNIQFVAADTQDTSLDGDYDAVMAFNLLHLVPDLNRALRRVNTLVKPGGLFISKTVCLPEGRFYGRFYSAGGLKFTAIRAILPVMQLLGKAPPVHFFRISTLEKCVTDAGFEIIETGNYPAQPPSRYIVARKV